MTRTTSPQPRTLSDEQVRTILLSDLTTTELANMMGSSRQTIRAVRVGKRYTDVFPDLPRASPLPASAKRTCATCAHHSWFVAEDGTAPYRAKVLCDLELPEVRTLGARAGCCCVYHSDALNDFLNGNYDDDDDDD